MEVSLLKISNFRGIRTGAVRLHDHTVLIGPNNSGKTTIVEALTLVLGRDRLIRTLTENDFYGLNPQPADRIRISATITGFQPNDFTAHPEWFRDGRSVPKWFDPDTSEVLPEKNKDRHMLACQIEFAARFDSDSLEVETARYFLDKEGIDVFAEENYVTVPSKLIRDIGFFLIPASRSWDRMFSFGSELFRRVIRSAGSLPAATVLQERDRLRNPVQKLEDDVELKPTINEVNREIERLLGVSTSVQLRLTTTDSDGVLEAIVPHFNNPHGPVVPSRRQGSGLISLQSLFLLLHFGQRRVQDGENFCMTLEEPELHLPPAVQRRVLSRLQSLSTQTIVSTHSPLVAAYCEPRSLFVIRNQCGYLSAKPLLKTRLEQHTPNAIRKLFQINRVEVVTAMMNEILLVPEGRLDYEWLLLLQRVVEMDSSTDQSCLFGIRIGVVPTGEARIKETCELLGNAHPKICALVDGDDAGKRYTRELSDASAPIQKVLSWPFGWTIEDVIGWVVEADEAEVIGKLNRELDQAPNDVSTMVARLKSEDRTEYGIKGDLVAYEIIANALTSSSECLRRASTTLEAVSRACSGENTPYFKEESNESLSVLRFNP